MLDALRLDTVLIILQIVENSRLKTSQTLRFRCILWMEGRMAQGRITDPKAALTFMTAGKATVTFRSAESGVRFTYKIRLAPKRNPNDADTWFVQLLNGPDNTGNFCYIGILRRDNGVYHYVWTSKARVNQSCASVKAFQYALDCFAKSSIPEKLEVYHEGRCGRCGRKLTVPESVTSGFGPECIGLVGGAVPQAVIASGYAAPQRGLHFDYVT